MSTAAQFQPSGSEVKAAAFHEKRRSGAMSQSRWRVLREFAHAGASTRNQIAERSGLPLSSVCGRCRELLDLGYLDVAGTTADRPARQMLEMSAEGVEVVAEQMRKWGDSDAE